MEKIKNEQSFLKKAKRFLSPVIHRKKIYFKFFIQALFVPLSWIISVLFLESITKQIQGGDIWNIYFILFLFLIFIVVFEVIIYATKNWWWMVTLYQSMDDLFNRHFRKYITLDNTKVEQIGSGKLVWIMYDGIFRWSEMLADMIIMIASLLVWSVFTMYMIGRIHIALPFIFLGLVILFLLITLFCNKKLSVFRSERYEYKNLTLRNFVKIISSKVEILQTWKLNKDLENLSYYLSQWSRISKQMSPYRTLSKRSAPFILHMSLFFLFIFILFKWIEKVDVAFLVWLSGTFILMQKTIADFVKFYVDFNKQMVSVEKLWDFFDTTPQIEGYEEWNTFEYKKWSIKLKDVSYGYDSNKPVFKNFSLKIPGNQITALVWPSGGWKSTLVKLIAGYIRQDSWDIFIDKQSLTETSLKSYYADVGYLTQEPSVFDGTVRENLMYGVNNPLCHSVTSRSIKGDRDASPSLRGISAKQEGEWSKEQEKHFNKHLKKIIKLAHCEFIYELPDGLDTEIGERGIKLSWGQKQRLAIAKIFLKDPKIIILDEPTSALDSLSEKKITEAMHNLFKNRTVLVIAHRLQTVKHADDIIVIENGEVIERGTHKELLKSKGFYKQMLDLQSGF